MQDREANLIRAMTETTWKFYAWIGSLFAVALWGLFAYTTQLRHGLIVTGLRDQISWGLYITNFVFFIGISHAGTLISAILRVSHAQWRRPITRLAEGITVFAICIGAPMVIIDLGRPDRMLNLFRHGRIQSPILWDVISVSTYLTGCLLYFYIPMIPDMALLAKNNELPKWRRRLYGVLSVGWIGSSEQWRLLERAIATMAIFIIPLAVSVHTVVSWIFAMTLRPGWNTSIFGPYFVTGAIYSGIAAVILSMYFLRKVFRLGDYIEELHFRNLGLLLTALSLIFLYFNINEYMTVGYKLPGADKALLDRLFEGDFAPYFKAMLGLTTLGPSLLLVSVLGVKRWKQYTIPGTVTAAAFVVLGAWLERYLIVVPTLSSPFLPAQGLPSDWMHYRPTWVEWSITAAAFAAFMLIYTFLSKLFPMVSIWETRETETVEEKAEYPTLSEALGRQTPAGVEVPLVGAHEGDGRAVPAILTQPTMLSILLIASIVLAAASARAGQPGPAADSKPAGTKPAPAKPTPKPTSLSLQWELVQPAAQPGNIGSALSTRLHEYLEDIFSPLFFSPKATNGAEQERTSTVKVTATLLDEKGAPLPYQAVGFGLETSFGTVLQFGKAPTDDQGKAHLTLRDRRCGVYPFQAVFGGDDSLKTSYAIAKVDFGACPAPALPSAGVLITPYATAPITLSFLFFYGTMWVAFCYAFGYLVLWRIRRHGKAAVS